MKIGLQITESDWPRDIGIVQNLKEIAKTADEVGFYSIGVPDHFFNAMDIVGDPVDSPKLEGYSTISYLAALTERIKLGLLMTCNFFRHPALLVKTVTTIDFLSGGRAFLGIGAGWYEREAKGLGIVYPSLRERFVRLEETLQIAKHMWRGDVTPYEGKYYHLAEPINSPQPISKPHPLIMIGGGGEKKTLRLVAKYGDACNLFIGSPLKEHPPSWRAIYENRLKFLRGKLAVLEQHCDRVGRSYGDVEKTAQVYVRLAPDAQDSGEVTELCQGLARLGIQHVIFNMPNVHEIEPIQTIGDEAIPQVRRL